MTHRIRPLACLLVFGAGAALQAQGTVPLDERAVAVAYHAITKTPLDIQAVAAASAVARTASSFDQPDVIRREAARLAAELAIVDPTREFVVRVNDNLSGYDHDRSEFTVPLFTPGYFIEVRAFDDTYRVVFSNAAAARAIPMAREPARLLDTRVAAQGRAVVDEIHFVVAGDGDPSGGVTGSRVVRATITGVRILDRAGNVLHEPEPRVLAASVAGPLPFDARRADVAGLRIGVSASQFEQTAARLFGLPERVPRSQGWFAGYARAIEVNSMGCMSIPGRRRGGEPGNVCVTAYVDASDVVRAIRIERVFPFIDGETFRATVVRRYGAVREAKQGSGLALGWGDEVPRSMAYDSRGPQRSLTAHYTQDDDMMSRSLNAAPKVRVTLQLVDAAWAATIK